MSDLIMPNSLLRIESQKKVIADQRGEIKALTSDHARLREALEETNAALYGAIGVNPELEGMGNTKHAMNLAKQALAGRK